MQDCLHAGIVQRDSAEIFIVMGRREFEKWGGEKDLSVKYSRK